MEYLLLTYQEEEPVLSEGAQRVIEEACRDNNVALRESGSLLIAATLSPNHADGVVCLHNGALVPSQRPTAPTGIYLIHAKDMNDAIRTASHMPQARLGPIEIRAVKIELHI